MARRGGTRTDLESAIFNPGLLTREALNRSFVARKATLEMLDAELRTPPPTTAGQQHRLFLGPRGYGKTTLLLRLHYLVEDDTELAARWQPLSFVEERYGIGDLADFWLEVVRELPPGRDGFPESTLQRLKQRFQHEPDRLAEAALETLKRWSQQHKKHVLLLIDNLNEVFYHIQDKRQLHQLRATLMETPWLRLIGFSPVYFEQLEDTTGPFYEFFAVERLQTLSLEETQEILEHWCRQDQRPDVLRRLTLREGRIKNLHLLTGGNPRLVAVIYELVKAGPLNTTLDDIEKLVDRMTPYFKSQIDGLPAQSRRVIDALARRWEPVPAKALKDELRLPVNQISAQLGRLKRDGWILQSSQDGSGTVYQVADRFYNIFYLIRYSRSAMDRLKGFVFFLRILFEDEDLARLAEDVKRFLDNLPQGEGQERGLQVTRLSQLAEAMTDPGLKANLYHDALRLSRSLSAAGQPLDELVDLPEARRLLGPERVKAEEQLQALSRKAQDAPLSIQEEEQVARLYLGLGEPVEAERCFRSLLKRVPGKDAYCHELAVTLMLQGKISDAQGLLEAIQTDDPTLSACVFNNLGGCGLLSGRLAQAEQHFRAALARQWRTEFSTNLVAVLKLTGKVPDALAHLRACAQRKEVDAWHLFELYALEKVHGSPKAARSALSRAAEKDGACGLVLASELSLEGNPSRAKKERKKAMEKLRTAELHPNQLSPLVQNLVSARAWEEADALARHWEERDGNRLEQGRLNRVIILAASGKHDEALRLLKDAVQHGLRAQIVVWWGEQLHKNRQYALAEHCARAAIRLDPSLPKAFALLSAALFEMGKLEEALDAARMAVRRDAGLARTQQMWALTGVRAGRWAQAEKAARAWAEQDPSNRHAWLLQLECAERLHPERAEALRAELRVRLVDANLAINAAHEAQQQGWSHAAVAAARIGTTLEPTAALAWNNLGAALFALKRYEEGRAAVEQALQHDPALVVGWVNLLRALSALQKPELLKERITQLVQDPSCTAERIMDIAGRLVATAQREPALQVARAFLEVHPEAEPVRFLLVGVLFGMGDWTAAAEHFTRLSSPDAHPEWTGIRMATACIRQDLADAQACLASLDNPLAMLSMLMPVFLPQSSPMGALWPGFETFWRAVLKNVRDNNALVLLINSAVLSLPPSAAAQAERCFAGLSAELLLGAAPSQGTLLLRWSQQVLRAKASVASAPQQLEDPALESEAPPAVDDDWEAPLEQLLLDLEQSDVALAGQLWASTARALASDLPDAALWCWGEVLRLDPAHLEALSHHLAHAQSTQNQPGILTFARRLVELQPESPTTAAVYAQALLDAGRVSEALGILDELALRFPHNREVQVLHLQALWLGTQQADAWRQLEALLEADPHDEPLWLLGLQWMRLEKTSTAEQRAWLERALEPLPASPGLVYAWARLELATPHPPLERIEARVAHAWMSRPDAPRVRELRAYLLIHRDRWREALGILDALLSTAGVLDAHERALMDLVMALGARGRPEAVVQVLQERGIAERWQPLVLALQLLQDARLEKSARVPLEVLKVALELRDRMTAVNARNRP